VSTTTIEHLRDPADVEGFASEARVEGRLALDTEFVWERTYSPVPCLLQLATAHRLAVLDPLEDVDVGPIAALVGDPSVQLVMHAPAGDLLLFATRYGVRATNVFDTQLAAGFVGHGISMAYDRLVERALNVTLTHNETFSDWSRRPLTEAQIAYASDDVRYLFDLADALIARLDQMGRRSWAEDEISRRYGPDATIEPDPQRAYLKVARRGRLSGRQLAALRAVAAWREEEARTRDMPPGWVLKDPSVVEVARRNPADAGALGKLRGLGSLSAPAAQRLLDALAGAAEAEPVQGARELPPGLARRVAAASALGAVLVRARCEGAHIAPELVATRAELESFVEAMANGHDEHALLSGWRRELVGAELKELVQGNVAIALEPSSPYVRTLALPPAPAE
jgi:ribonuclease D